MNLREAKAIIKQITAQSNGWRSARECCDLAGVKWGVAEEARKIVIESNQRSGKANIARTCRKRSNGQLSNQP